MTPIGVTSSFPTLPPGPGVWRLTPPFAAPQTPWVANVRRFVLASVDQFLPDPPPSLQSDEWVEAFNEIKAYGAATSSARTDEQTTIAKFWLANASASTTGSARDIAAAGGLDLLETARLSAMVNLVGADAQMVRPVRQVPLPVLAAGHRDRPHRRHRRRLRTSAWLRRR